jgi:hypothetical protein
MKIIHAQLVIEGLQGKLINHAFIDPIANYMEVLFSSSVQSCFHDKDPTTVAITHYNFDFVDKKSSCPFDCANKQSSSPLVSATT